VMYVGVDVHKNVCRAAIVNDERVKLLMTMPGLGYFAASLLVAEICDINRFSSDKKLVSWAGLAPGVRQSGDRTVGGRITKQGISSFVGSWIRLLRLLGFMMIGSGSFTNDTLGGGVVRRLLWLLLMRCFGLSISC